jgi:23S rRNA pseudouridine2604 synthase
MQAGVPIPATLTNPRTVIQSGQNRFKITLNQGLNRQIRRMCEYFGYKVVDLKRISIMHLKLGGLEIGQWRDLNEGELGELMEQLGDTI